MTNKWALVFAGAILDAFLLGIAFYSLTAMLNPVAIAFGWGFAQISFAVTLRGIGIGLLNPLLGALVDRVSAAKLVFFGVALTGCGLFALSFVKTLPLFYLTFIILSVGVMFCTHLVPMAAVMKRFNRNTGKAASILSFGVALGGLTIPLVTIVIDKFGWQTAIMLVGVMVWVIGFPLVFFFRNPGANPVEANDKTAKEKTARTTVSEKGIFDALRSRAFWHIGIAFTLQIAALDAVLVHIMPYLLSVGINRTQGSAIAMALPLASLPARFIYGWLSDRFPRQIIIAFALVMTGLGMFLLNDVSANGLFLIIIFVIVYGFGLGGYSPLMPPIIKQYFGANNFGAIYGMLNVMLTCAAVSTPLIAGIIYDDIGSYGSLWTILGWVSILGAVVMLLIPKNQSIG